VKSEGLLKVIQSNTLQMWYW